MQARRDLVGIAALGFSSAAAVFAADLVFPIGAAVAALYVIPVLCAAVTGRKIAVIATLAGVAGLIFAAGVLAQGSLDGAEIAGRMVVMVGLAIAGVMAYIQAHIYRQVPNLELRLHDRERAADQAESVLHSSEAMRRDAERRYLAMFNQTFQLIALLSPAGRIEDVNDTFVSVTGLSRNIVIGLDIWKLPLHGDDPELGRKLRFGVETAASGSFFRMEASIEPNGGREAMILDLSIKPIRDADGNVEVAILEARDITEQKVQAEALARRERLNVVGQLASGIAHDVNNTFTVISGNLEMVVRRLDDDSRQKRRIEHAIDAVFHGKSLTSRLLAFARRQYLAPLPLVLASLITETCALLEPTLPDNVKLEYDLPDGLWPCWVDAGQLQTALMNLVLNSRDAMPAGGRITIGAANFALDRDEPHLAIPRGDYLEISVVDDGAGIPPEILGRVMEPYFTTKEGDKGTGMGLSMVYGFARQSGGDLVIESRTGVGTEARLYLPRAPAHALTEQAAHEEVGLNQSRILVVEDEDGVRDVVVGMLEDLGYSAFAVPDADSALRQLMQPGSFDLVLTDLMLPGDIDVGDFVETVRREQADMPIIYSSGMPEEARSRLSEPLNAENFVSKPYRMAELHDVIARALGRGRG